MRAMWMNRYLRAFRLAASYLFNTQVYFVLRCFGTLQFCPSIYPSNNHEAVTDGRGAAHACHRRKRLV